MCFFVFSVFVFLQSCGKDSNNQSDTERKLNDLAYTVVEEKSLNHKSTEVSGSGTIAFLDPTSEKNNSFTLTFALDDGGEIIFIANAQTGLKNGISLKFKRSGDKLLGGYITNDREIDISASFQTINSSQDISFQIDVHNGESPAHVLVWKQLPYTEDNALFNSEANSEAISQGSGNLWGAVLSNATLKIAQAQKPKFEDD